MRHVASEMQRQGFTVPLLIGGATTSKIHTAVKVDPNYSNGPVIHVTDASRAVGTASNLLSTTRREAYTNEIQDEYDEGEEAPYQQLEDGEYLFMGRIDLDDFNEIMVSELPRDEADTLGGFIYSRLGRVPTVGGGSTA